MPRNYVRKTNRGKWDEESMGKAIAAMMEGKMGAPKASQEFNVPQTTLERRFKAD